MVQSLPPVQEAAKTIGCTVSKYGYTFHPAMKGREPSLARKSVGFIERYALT